MFLAPELVATPLPLPFLQATPIGLLELVGLLGAIWYRRVTTWAQPLLLVAISTYAYRIVFLLQTAHNDHTGYAQYTDRLTGMALLAAGVLTASQAAPAAAARVSSPVRRRELAAASIVALVAYAAVQGWQAWMPGPRGIANVNVGPAGEANLATSAHVEPLPGGNLPRFAPASLAVTRYFPAVAVRHAIDSVRPPATHPVVLCFDQRLFAYYPYYAFSPPARLSTNTLTRWDDRVAALGELAAVTDPTTFAQQSLHTKFGRIDAFVLVASGRVWRWNDIAFSPMVFGTGTFHVTRIRGGVVVAVRVD
jgi:hypothetical protein